MDDNKGLKDKVRCSVMRIPIKEKYTQILLTDNKEITADNSKNHFPLDDLLLK